jgi:hypothetical protein
VGLVIRIRCISGRQRQTPKTSSDTSRFAGRRPLAFSCPPKPYLLTGMYLPNVFGPMNFLSGMSTMKQRHAGKAECQYVTDVGAADKAVIQLVRVQPYELPDSDT